MSDQRSKTSFERCALLALALVLGPATLQGASFPASVTLGGETLVKRGEDTFRYLFWSVYDGALYLPADLPSSDALADAPKSLRLHYLREVEAADIRKSGNRLVEKNTTEAERAALGDRLETINAAYRDVGEGDVYALEYLPGEGTTLSLNGTEVVRIDGADFASVYFRIWLGDEPVSKDFRDALLAQ